MQPLTVKAAIKQFLADCAAAYRSPNTLIWYTTMLKRFEQYCGVYALDDLKPTQVVRYVRAVRAEEDEGLIKRRTAHGILRALRTFLKWASATHDLLDLSTAVKLPPFTRLTSRALDMTTIRALLAAAPETRAGLRDKAILMFFLDTGCRSGGLCGLLIDDVDLTRHCAVVKEKGGHKRTVPFTRATKEYLIAWVRVRPPQADYFFCGVRERDEGAPLTPNSVLQMLYRLANRAGVSQRVFAHALRHTMATQYTRNGGNLRTLQAILGHADIRSTQSYIGIDVQDLINQHERFSAASDLNRHRR